MADINWFSWMLDNYERLVNFANKMFDFLFHEFTVIGFDISIWQIIGGVGLVAILVAGIVKAIAPFL